MAFTRYQAAHAAAAKDRKLDRKAEKAGRFHRGRTADPAPEPSAGFNSNGQFDSAFPNAPADAEGVGRTLSRGL